MATIAVVLRHKPVGLAILSLCVAEVLIETSLIVPSMSKPVLLNQSDEWSWSEGCYCINCGNIRSLVEPLQLLHRLLWWRKCVVDVNKGGIY